MLESVRQLRHRAGGARRRRRTGRSPSNLVRRSGRAHRARDRPQRPIAGHGRPGCGPGQRSACDRHGVGAGTTPSPFASAPRWRRSGPRTEMDGGMRATPHGAGFARERPATAGTGPRCPGEPPAVAWGPCRGRGAPSEGRRLATDPDDAVVLARALAGEGYLEFRRSHVAEAQAVWQEALEIAQHAGDERRRSSAAWRSPPRAAAARTGPETSSTGRSTWLDGRETINSSGCYSARPPRGTCGWATTRPLRTPRGRPRPGLGDR